MLEFELELKRILGQMQVTSNKYYWQNSCMLQFYLILSIRLQNPSPTSSSKTKQKTPNPRSIQLLSYFKRETN